MKRLAGAAIEALDRLARHRLVAAVLIGWIGAGLAVAAGRLEAVRTVERQTLDVRFRRLSDTTPMAAEITVVDINEGSINELEPYFGRWPWPRDVHAQVIQYLMIGGASVVAFDVGFWERVARSSVSEQDYARLRDLAEAARTRGDSVDELAAAIEALEPGAGDDALGQITSIAGNVVHAMIFKRLPRSPTETDVARIRETLAPHALGQRAPEVVAGGALDPSWVFDDATVPLRGLAEGAYSIAHINHSPDPDGPARWTYPVAAFGDLLIPSLPLAAAARRLGVPLRDIRIEPGRLVLPRPDTAGGDIVAPLDAKGRMPIFYQRPVDFSETRPTPYPYIPFADVLWSSIDYAEGREPKYPPEFFRDKVILVGATAGALFDLRATPFSPITPGIEIHCHVVENLLSGRFLRTTPAWYEPAAAVALALLVAVGGMFMRPTVGFVWAAAAVGLYDTAAFETFRRAQVWAEVIVPSTAGAAAYLLLVVFKFMTEQREKRQIRGAFGRYLPPAVLEEVLADPKRLRLGGEKRTVTLLFSDVAGFTSMSERLPPEEVAHLLNEYLTRMTECVFRNGGTLDKYMGDAIMAEYGAPIPQADHAARACRTALEMMDELARLQAKWKAEGRDVISCRIGIHSGEAVVGNMGSDQLFDYTAIGNTVNTAARLEPLNKDFGTRILVSGEAAEAAVRDDPEIVVREIARVVVKGRATALPVCELVGRRSSLPPAKARALGLFAEGYRLYLGRKFDEAKAKFAEALAADAADGPSETYIRLCDEMLAAPPPADWDGTYEQKTK